MEWSVADFNVPSTLFLLAVKSEQLLDSVQESQQK